jgi:hypothetical protein
MAVRPAGWVKNKEEYDVMMTAYPWINMVMQVH